MLRKPCTEVADRHGPRLLRRTIACTSPAPCEDARRQSHIDNTLPVRLDQELPHRRRQLNPRRRCTAAGRGGTAAAPAPPEPPPTPPGARGRSPAPPPESCRGTPPPGSTPNTGTAAPAA